MRIYTVILPRYVEVDTDLGCFKVFKNGIIERWTDNEDTGESYYGWFDEGKYNETDLEAIKAAAMEKLK